MKKLYTIKDCELFTIEDIWQLYRQHVNPSQVELIGAFPFGRELVEKAEGCYIYLRNGKKILDLTGGIGVLNHGHNHPKILRARSNFSIGSKMEVHKNYFSPYIAALSSNISSLIPPLQFSYFANSGAEAIEGALKLAYKYHEGKRAVVLHSSISFHGKTLGAASLTGSPEVYFKFPTISGVDKFEYNNLDSVVSQINKYKSSNNESSIYAIVVEPLNASTMQQCSDDFLINLRDLCTKNNIILIFDEVYTGWGKTGYLFNYMRVAGLNPDILCYAKSFGGGKSSISGFSYTDELSTSYNNSRDATLHSTTYYGFGEETITAIEAVNIIVDDNLVENASNIGKEVEKEFKEIANNSKFFKLATGSGALWGFIPDPKYIGSIVSLIQKSGILKNSLLKDTRFSEKLISGAIVNHLYSKHNILTYFGVNIGNPLIISFPLISSKSEIELALTALRETFSKSMPSLIFDFISSKFKGPSKLND
jgi:putrescine aminotransferase